MPDYPSGLVNLNFGMHGCIHLGTQLPAQVNFFSGVGSFYCSKMVVDVVLVKIPGKNDVTIMTLTDTLSHGGLPWPMELGRVPPIK